jgi:hypothetical protein
VWIAFVIKILAILAIYGLLVTALERRFQASGRAPECGASKARPTGRRSGRVA